MLIHLNNTHTAQIQKPALQFGSVKNRVLSIYMEVAYITAACLRRAMSPEVKWAGARPVEQVAASFPCFCFVFIFLLSPCVLYFRC
jgi:hypothetical protein